MNYLNQKSIAIFSQISILSLFFLAVLQIPVFAQNSQPEPQIENKYLYSDASSRNLSVVGVAISTNLGTKHSEIDTLPATIYKDVLSIEEVLAGAQEAWDDIISKNMILIQEYLNVSQTDIKSMLDKSYDKNGALKTYLKTLKSRYNLANKQIVSLTQQKQVFEATMTQTQEQIEALKDKISTDFSAVNTQATLENIDVYLELKNKYTTARMYVIFINKFIEQYEYLNEYNTNIANILIQNSDAIIKDSYVVLPESGDTNILKDLNLLFESWSVQ